MESSKPKLATTEQTFRIELQPLPGWNAPGIQRLRLPLKALLRSFGLRCTSVEAVGDVQKQNDCKDDSTPHL